MTSHTGDAAAQHAAPPSQRAGAGPTQQALPYPDSLWHAVVDAQVDAMMVFRPIRGTDGHVVDLEMVAVNEAAAASVGVPERELLRRGVRDLWQAESVSQVVQWAEQALAEGRPIAPDDVVLSAWATGEPRHFDVRLAPVQGLVACSWRDVTQRVELNEQVRASEELYRLMVDNAGDVVYHTAAGVLRWISPSATEVLGWSPDELMGKPTVQYWHPDDRDRAVALRDASYAGQLGRGTLRFRRKDGRYTWVEAVLRPITEPDGSPGAVGVLRDVNDRVLAEQALEQVVQRFQAALRAQSDAEAFLETVRDPAGALADLRFVELNPAAETYFGRPRSEVLGQLASEVFPELRSWGLWGDIVDLVGTGDSLERMVRAPDGRAFEVRGVKAEDGLALSWRDVTDRLAAEQQLAESEERYRMLAEHSADVVYLLDAGEVLWVSPSVTATLGYSVEEFTGMNVFDLIADEDKSRVAESAEAVLAGEAVRVRHRMRHKDGSLRWVEAHAQLAEPGTQRLLSTTRDIESEVEAQQALAASQQQYRLLAENSTDVVYLAGLDQNVVWVSPGITATLGWTPEEIVGAPIHRLLRPNFTEATTQLRRDLYAGHEVPEPEGGWTMEMRAKDGSWHWMSGHATHVTGSDGAPLGIVAGFRDITHLVAAREATRAMIDAMLDPYVVLAAVRGDDGEIVDFNYVEANPAACRYRGISREDYVGASYLALHPQAHDNGVLQDFERIVRTAVPLVIEGESYPHQPSDRVFDTTAFKVGDGIGMTWRDVTDRVQAWQQVAESEARFRMLAENTADIVAVVRSDRFLWVSPSVKDALGYQVQDILSIPPSSLLHPDDFTSGAGNVELLQAGRDVLLRHRVRLPNGGYRWVETHARLLGLDGEVLGVSRVIDDQVALEQQLRHRATHDPLTNLANRHHAYEVLQKLAQRRPRTGGRIAVAYCDLDNLKEINDSFGHNAGDEALQALAGRIPAVLRSGDLVARIGGDEFLVILDGVHDLPEAASLANRILDRARQPLPIGDGLRISLSMGVTLLEPGEPIETAVARADAAMYEAKTGGKDHVVLR